eukprot:CAMPEP_0202869656 /NCGR_PEP_ID=MMETSP1391-20130828/12575_1 /ASSEMBLY_ACC=CAM_ASM_000867 /TAXON_ID=1034604 /ORGANISM="Chlamydomonas leiostraca, Strain SAG 11-49" /LENGTH=268 /DNA_ID=CAMNT_0049549997 /DNA_START=62 /DNA_END=868 /DNA_ORIENTATION=-
MHDPNEQDRDAELLVTPPSASGRQGAISAQTIHQVAALRSKGVMFVVITGARLSTLLMRLPYLPAADAFVCENGGRVFYPGSPLPTACPITEDAHWRDTQAAAGPTSQDGVEPKARTGALWEWYAKLAADGWVLDANGYTTSFRCHAKGGKSMAQLEALAKEAPQGLDSSFNLGAADFYPDTSGKVRAARYLMARFQARAQDCVFLCDDDNDMELAAEVGRAYLPSVTSESVRRAVAARPEHFVQATKKGTEATEEMLLAVSKDYKLL